MRRNEIERSARVERDELQRECERLREALARREAEAASHLKRSEKLDAEARNLAQKCFDAEKSAAALEERGRAYE